MWRRRSKTLTKSSDLNEDVEISVELSPQLKRTSLPQKQWPTTSDWQKCADSFSGLNPLPERSRKRKRHCISAFQEIEKKLKKSPSAKEFDSENDGIVWSSSDEDAPSSQSVPRNKSQQQQQQQQKVRRQILAASTHSVWPAELCKSLLPQNNRSKSRRSFEKMPSTDQETRWRRHNDKKWLTTRPHPHFDKEIDVSVQEFQDSDEDFVSKQPELQKKSTIIETFSSDEGSPVVDSTPPSSLPVDEQASDLNSKSDVDISTWSSSNISGECASTIGGGRKTSEWLQALQMSTPTKNQNNSASSSQQETSNMFDSAKKKRRHKYNKDGLALKLSRIISREKTAMNVWSFRQSELPIECKNILTACVHSFSCKVGMVIARCSLGSLSKNNVWTSRNGDSYQTVLFNLNVLELLKLQPGSVIHIYPPWQELLVPHTGEKILLCTYYCQLVEPVPRIWDKMDNPVLDSNRICHSYQWDCPCSTSDGSLRYCPASTCPVLTKCPKIQTSVSSDVLVSKQMSKPPSSLNIVGLRTEDAATGGASTILNSIQAAPTTFQQGLCFQAMVLRIFCSHNTSMQNTKKRRQNIQSWSVLVEDSQGTVCIVHISEQKQGSKNSLNQLIQSAEGETWNFFGLRVFSRSNRHRDPALFSMIDKVWICPIPQNESPKSSSESDHVIAAQVKPGFCYITGRSEDVGIESGVLPHRSSFVLDEPASHPQLSLGISTLQEIKQQDNDATRMRFTFIAKIFCLRSKLKESQQESQSGASANANAKIVLFLSDPSVSQKLSSCNYMAIHCLPSCYLSPELTANKKNPGSLVALLRDVLFEQDSIAFADGYTRIWVWPPPSNIRHQIVPSVSEEFIRQYRAFSIPLQSLQENSQCNSLFKVQGVIYSVDQKTAVTWETCPYCDEEQLAFRQDEQQDRQLVCLNCDVHVEETVLNINLDVIIRCLSLPGHCEVRVNLLQPTVESLLPKGDHKDGYDVSAVLGQQVGPLTCLLKKQTTSQQHPVYYLEEIQSV